MMLNMRKKSKKSSVNSTDDKFNTIQQIRVLAEYNKMVFVPVAMRFQHGYAPIFKT